MTQQQAVERAIELAQIADREAWRVARNAYGTDGVPATDRLIELGNLWAAIAAQLPFETAAELVVPAPPYEPCSTGCGGHAPDVTAVLDRDALLVERQRLVDAGVPSEALAVPLCYCEAFTGGHVYSERDCAT